jgi:hypothetical protein
MDSDNHTRARQSTSQSHASYEAMDMRKVNSCAPIPDIQFAIDGINV